jgi:hypothetical protein
MRFLLCFALLACTTTNTNPPADDTPDCAELTGQWAISGACGADACQITQSGCAITQVSCTSGAHSTSGTVDNDSFSYTGVSGGGAPATCSGTNAGNSISGTCNVDNLGTCAFTGQRR